MDIITISQLEFKVCIGIEAWEKKCAQKIILDVNIGTDIRKSAQSDNINDTIDYSEVARMIERFICIHQFQLIETLAEKISDLLFQQFKIKWLKLTVYKPKAIEKARTVALTIERTASTCD